MGREKRKARLNKGEATEFIGFGAFAAPAASTTTDAVDEAPTNTTTTTNKSPSKTLALAPVYMGSEAELSVLFPRIGQKRDATTNAKALGDLKDYFLRANTPKKAQVDALAHFLYLFQSKLHYDNTPRVRAAALECCHAAHQRVPKAFWTYGNQQPELLGMMLCGRADPAADVRKAADQLLAAFFESSGDETDSDDQDKIRRLIHQAVWDYVKRILSYGKPMAMYEDLFMKKSADGGSKLSERQEEELDERFVRIVGTALSGLQLHLLQPQTKEMSPPLEDTKTFLWKTLNSPKAALRRRTYQLLSTCCQKVPSLVDTTKLANILNQNLSSEKEPTNVKILLETLLALVASVPSTDRTTFLSQFHKALTKLFSKGCHGATQWAPTVLPIVALLPPDVQPNILTSIWQGKSGLVGAADQLEVVAAVAETATFLLIQQSHELAEVLAKCFLQALQVFVTRSIGSSGGAVLTAGPIPKAYDHLGQILANDLQRLDTARDAKPNSAMVLLDEWFWDVEINKVLVTDPAVDLVQLIHLIQRFNVTTKTGDENSKSHLPALWKQIFHFYLQQCQASSALVPGRDIYQLWMVLLERISMDDLFDNTSTSMQTFVMNDLLRWMVIHTSSLSDQFDMDLAKYDFELYRQCQRSRGGEGTWDPLLRELVAAKCDLEALVAGLVILSKTAGVEAVKSTILEDLCRQVAREAIIELHSEDHDSEEELSDATELHMHYHRKASDLLQNCVGLGEVDGVLVDKSVVLHWMGLACPADPQTSRGPNAVLETLVALIRDGYFDESSDMRRILIQAWRQGEDLWTDTVLPWITKNESIRALVAKAASSELQATLRQASSEARVDSEISLQWSERAVRLFQLCQDDAPPNGEVPRPSLELLGLAEPRIWEHSVTRKGFASASLMNVMELLDTTDEKSFEYRWSLFDNSATASDPDQLLMRILLHLSDGATDLLQSDGAQRRRDNSFTLLSKLGGESIPNERINRWIISFLPMVASLLVVGDDDVSCRGVAVLSQLVSLGFAGLRPAMTNGKDSLSADEIREGDSVWYIPDTEKPHQREEVTIVKIHKDIPSEVYYTIKVTNDGKAQERQTVRERLRSSPTTLDEATISLVSVDQVDVQGSKRRQNMTECLMKDLVQTGWDSWKRYEFEILNILIAQLGLFGTRGIGSTHYTIFQKLLALQTELLAKLDGTSSPEDFPISGLWSLALALGYGCNTPVSPWNSTFLGFDPEPTVDSLLRLLYDEEIAWLRSPSLDIMRSTIVVLTVSLPALKHSEKVVSAQGMLYDLVDKVLLEASNGEGFGQDDYIALRAIENGRGEEEASSEQDAVVALVGAFAARWENKESAQWLGLSICKEVFEEVLTKKSRLAGLAGRKHADSLGKVLFVDSKRWLALRFLEAYAKLGRPLHDSSPGNAMNKATAKRLKTWSANLVPEEAEELEEDVELVCQWVPQTLMNEVESWQEANDKDYHVNENDAFGRLSSWLAFMRVVEVAGGKDSMNRTALASYTKRCGAVESILNLAISYANVGTDRKVKFETMAQVDAQFSSGSPMELPKLAATVMFRTVELFPTLSKNWWEMTCPSYFRDPVRDFVESSVAPELLRRELQRIKAASSFGEMTVKGSVISREVTALYAQDDFTLAVAIKLPPSFPFRRAEVDCSKTFGVPEKRWKFWSLQITQMLNNQGGTLTDALLLWKENVDKEFEGIEPCPVCYSVVHIKTHKLPEMECKTCQNRFHFDCLTQWFRSSGKNACVLCQQPWAGTRVV